MIPKVIHFCWFGGKKKNSLVKKCIKSWRKFCPDYQIVEWNESNFNLDICPYVRQAYQEKKWAFVADYFRFWVLATHGGVYLDTDVRLFQSFDNFLSGDFFCGYEHGMCLEPAIIGGMKDNTVASEFLKVLSEKQFIINGECDLTPLPVKFTAFYREHYEAELEPDKTVEREGRIIVKKEIFRPKKTSHGTPIITDSTVAMHCYAGSWISSREKRHVKLSNLATKLFGQKFVDAYTEKHRRKK